VKERTIGGRTNRYADWRKQVVALVEEQQLPEAQRDLVTEPMMVQAWRDHETPEYFVSSIRNLS
jgi:hypothetical protein